MITYALQTMKCLALAAVPLMSVSAFGADSLEGRLMRRTAVRDDRLKPTAIFRRDVDDDPCSHAESLNCFARFGNRPNESNHYLMTSPISICGSPL